MSSRSAPPDGCIPITAELSSAHLREIAVQQLGLLEEEVTADCQVSMDAARRKGWLVHEEQPVDLVAPEADVRNVPEDVISVRGSEVDDASYRDKLEPG